MQSTKKIAKLVKQTVLPPYRLHEIPVLTGMLVLLLSLLLTVLLIRTDTNDNIHAAMANSVEPENGTLTGNVTIDSDANASGGKYIIFGTIPTPTQTASCTISNILVNSCGPWLGASARGNPGTPSNPLTTAQQNDQVFQFNYLATLVGRNLDIMRNFDACSFSNGIVTCANGLPFSQGNPEQIIGSQPNTYADMNWKPAGVWTDANGSNPTVNAEIQQVANNIKQIPHPVFLTIWHEPQNDVSAFDNATQQTNCTSDTNFTGLKGSAGTPADYVAMWQNVENIFRQQGVTNVVWMMDYQGTSSGQWDCLVQPLWPGNSYVDWVAYDSYSGANLKTWSATVGRMYNVLQALSNPTTNFASKPWGVAEFDDCNSSDEAQISQYFGDAKATLDANTYPNLKMYMIYASSLGPGAGLGCLTDYNSSGTYDTTKQTSFNQFANDPLLK